MNRIVLTRAIGMSVMLFASMPLATLAHIEVGRSDPNCDANAGKTEPPPFTTLDVTNATTVSFADIASFANDSLGLAGFQNSASYQDSQGGVVRIRVDIGACLLADIDFANGAGLIVAKIVAVNTQPSAGLPNDKVGYVWLDKRGSESPYWRFVFIGATTRTAVPIESATPWPTGCSKDFPGCWQILPDPDDTSRSFDRLVIARLGGNYWAAPRPSH